MDLIKNEDTNISSHADGCKDQQDLIHQVGKTDTTHRYHICLKQKPKLAIYNMTRNELITEVKQLKEKYEVLKRNPQNINNHITNNIILFSTGVGGENIRLITEKFGGVKLIGVNNETMNDLLDQIKKGQFDMFYQIKSEQFDLLQ